MSPDRDALVVTARLDVAVEAPDGRTATVRVTDQDGTLVVDVGHLPALLAALPGALVLPRSPAALRRTWRLLGGSVVPDVPGAPGAVWVQPVDVLVDGHVLLRRRGGAWRPTSRLLAPAAAGAAGAVVVVAAVVAVVVAAAAGLGRLRRAVRG